YYDEPLVVDHAKDNYVYDIDGKEYLDFFGGILTVSVGHCNEKVTKAIEEQTHKLQHASTLYPNEPHVRLAEKLAQITPGRLQKSFFTNSGTEANETAVLIAQLYTKCQDVIALRHSYSGRSYMAWGRTGGKMFGIEQWGVEPDIMTFAKGMANGVPIGATIATPEVADSIKGMTISTFGGNPVTAAAALATIQVVEEENLVENARVMGKRLRDGLEALKQKYPVVGDVRGMGLMQAMELVGDNKKPDTESLKRLFEATKKQGLLIGKGGLMGNVVRIAPPLNVTQDQIDQALKVLDQSFAQL